MTNTQRIAKKYAKEKKKRHHVSAYLQVKGLFGDIASITAPSKLQVQSSLVNLHSRILHPTLLPTLKNALFDRKSQSFGKRNRNRVANLLIHVRDPRPPFRILRASELKPIGKALSSSEFAYRHEPTLGRMQDRAGKVNAKERVSQCCGSERDTEHNLPLLLARCHGRSQRSETAHKSIPHIDPFHLVGATFVHEWKKQFRRQA